MRRTAGASGKRFHSLDVFKWAAALLVAANHTSPFLGVWDDGNFFLVDILSRIAVPFFFMVTGFFALYPANGEEGRRKRIGSVRRTALLYLAASALYLPVQLFRCRDFSAGAAIKMFLFDGTYYHLWYLPAAILGLFLTYALLRAGKRMALAATIFLYAVGIFGDSYYGIAKSLPFIRRGYEGMFCLFTHTRNGLFLAPLFLLLGYFSAEKVRETDFLESASHTLKKRTAAVFLLALCMTAEGFLVRRFHLARWDSMYLFLPPLMWHLFLLLLAAGERGREDSLFFLRGPMLFYLVHPMTALFIKAAAKRCGAGKVSECSLLYFGAVVSGSLLAVFGISALWGRLQKRERGV